MLAIWHSLLLVLGSSFLLPPSSFRGVPAMQQFTRSLTREIEVGGERLAVTLSKEGLSVRPVGGRRPPHHMSWETWLCAVVAHAAGQEPTADEVHKAFEA